MIDNIGLIGRVMQTAIVNIGQIISEINYNEKDGDTIFNASNSFLIKNKKEFAKKFQIKPSKVKDLNNFKIGNLMR